MSSCVVASASTVEAAGVSGSAYASGLTADQLAQFERDGYLILPDFFTVQTANALKAHVDQLVSGIDLSTHPKTVFRGGASGSQTDGIAEDKNRYFLDSADKVSYFFEEQAWKEDGTLAVPLEASINKIGHYLHVKDAPFAAFTNRPETKQLAKSLGFKEPVVLQSMVICKQPRIGGAVVPHRDSTFLHTQPSTATGLWFALEDCTQQNGCLSFVPGSHKDGANQKRFVRSDAPLVASINNVQDASAVPSPSGPNNAGVNLSFSGEDRGLAQYTPEQFVTAEVKAGTLVLIHGEVVHASMHNHSDKSRYIYTFHLIDREGTTYPTSNWLQSNTRFPMLNDSVQPTGGAEQA